MRKKLLVEKLGSKLPAGMSKADVDAVLQFLYGAFDKQAAKKVQLFFPYIEDEGQEAPQITVVEFVSWLQQMVA